ncbi:MAG: ANTAR domain-containing protein [Pseudomonadota bacterium]
MGDKPLQIVVIDENRIRASIIEDGLREAGFSLVSVIDDVANAMGRVVELDPDVIFMDLANPKRDELEYMLQISRAVKRPIAMFVDQSDQAATEAAIEAGVSAYIVDGLKKERVHAILEMAVSRFNAFDRLQKELAAAKSELAERKAIDKAKALLMRTKGIDEPAAYALLRRTAMNQNRKIAEVAESLLLAADLLDGGRDT